MISVCMAVKNGAPFVHSQLESIRFQLTGDDEIIISDDNSTDNTLEILETHKDHRIRIIKNPKDGLVSNFENAIKHSRGEIIFLSDQDDVWMPYKVKTTLPYLRDYDLVVSDCKVVNNNFDALHDSFFRFNSSSSGIIRNLAKNSYMGCCMAFKRSLLAKALPFPSRLTVHDQWLGMIGELYGRVLFLPEKLVAHRRHDKNASTTFHKSNHDWADKFSNRLNLALSLMKTRYGS